MSATFKIYVDTTLSLDELAAVIEPTVGRSLERGDDVRITRDGMPVVELRLNDGWDGPSIEDGVDLAAYPYILYVEGDSLEPLTTALVDVLADKQGFPVAVEDDGAGLVAVHDPDQRQPAAG